MNVHALTSARLVNRDLGFLLAPSSPQAAPDMGRMPRVGEHHRFVFVGSVFIQGLISLERPSV